MLYLSRKEEVKMNAGAVKMMYDLQLMIVFFLSKDKNGKALKKYCDVLKTKPLLLINSYMDLLLGNGFERSLSEDSRLKKEKYGQTLM